MDDTSRLESAAASGALPGRGRLVAGRQPGATNARSVRALGPLAIVAVILFGIFFAGTAQVRGLRINTTGSAPLGVYRYRRPADLTRGQLVAICLPVAVSELGLIRGYLPAGDCPGGGSPILKRVVALPSDTVELQETLLAVNGSVIDRTPLRAVDSRGRPLEHARLGRHVVRENEVWVLGVYPDRSWDSRYFGPIPVQGIMGSATPLFTLPGGSE